MSSKTGSLGVNVIYLSGKASCSNKSVRWARAFQRTLVLSSQRHQSVLVFM